MTPAVAAERVTAAIDKYAEEVMHHAMTTDPLGVHGRVDEAKATCWRLMVAAQRARTALTGVFEADPPMPAEGSLQLVAQVS